jgi:hypothetical protein
MELKSYYIGKPVKGICKQYAIWGSGDSNSSYPIVYLQNPKYIDEKNWDTICNSIQLILPQGFEL